MILYELVCEHGHSFESWFRDSAAFDALAAAHGLNCPVCGSSSVGKALMAPRLARRKGHDDRPTPREEVEQAASGSEQSKPAAPPKLRDLPETVAMVNEFLEHVREHVETTCDYVGDQFAEEARRIHYGESEARGIYGEATPEDTKALHEEGVDIIPLPGRRTSS
jgi:hypothetical protein